MKKGFTLIELLVVIAIIGILASVVLASLGSARTNARDAATKANFKEFQKAVELYYVANGSYPSTDGIIGVSGDSHSILHDSLVPDFIPSSAFFDTIGSHHYWRSDASAWGGDGSEYCFFLNLDNPTTEDQATYTSGPWQHGVGTYPSDFAICGGN